MPQACPTKISIHGACVVVLGCVWLKRCAWSLGRLLSVNQVAMCCRLEAQVWGHLPWGFVFVGRSLAQVSWNFDCAGWSLEFGKVCTAPPGYDGTLHNFATAGSRTYRVVWYTGPCEHKAYMSGASEPDKKAFEAACRVEWAVAGNSCVHDYAAACS